MATLTQTFEGVELRRAIGSRRTTLLVLGGILVALGGISLANVPMTEQPSVGVVASCMLLAALAQIVMLLLASGAESFVLPMLSAFFHGAAGALALQDPSLSARPLGVGVGVLMISAAVLRGGWAGEAHVLPGWRWMAASAAISAIAAAVFFAGWSAAWVPATVLAAELMLQGAMLIGFAVALRAETK